MMSDRAEDFRLQISDSKYSKFQIPNDSKMQIADSKVRTNTYRVRARNTSVDSENKIHDDETALQFGFRGGLVPGVTVYAYMTVPLVAQFGLDWLERGSMQVKFHQPFYDGDQILVKAEINADANAIKAEPIKAKPRKAEPIKAEPIETEPIETEPIKAEPIKAEAIGT